MMRPQAIIENGTLTFNMENTTGVPVTFTCGQKTGFVSCVYERDIHWSHRVDKHLANYANSMCFYRGDKIFWNLQKIVSYNPNWREMIEAAQIAITTRFGSSDITVNADTGNYDSIRWTV